MKTKILLFCAAMFFVACGSSSEGWKTNDLRYIRLVELDEDSDEVEVHVDLSTGQKVMWGDYWRVSLFYDDYAIAEGSEGYCFLNKDGDVLKNKSYHAVTIFHDGLAWAAEFGGPLVAINKKGDSVFTLQGAQAAGAFHEGLAFFVDTVGLLGLVDKKGKIVVEPRWITTGFPMVVNGMIVVGNEDGKSALANKKGEILTGFFDQMCADDFEEYFLSKYVQALSEGRIPVKQSGKWGVIDEKGAFIIDPQFDQIVLDGPNYLFKKKQFYGWCNKEGQYIINPQFTEAIPFFGQDLTPVEDKTGAWGFIDKTGAWVITSQFREAQPFLACGIAPVKDKESREWGAIDKTGKWVVNPQFQYMLDFGVEDKLLVSDQSRSVGVIDAHGKYVVTPVYVEGTRELLENMSGLGATYIATSGLH